MEETGTVRKNTVFVGGVAEDVDESVLFELFSTFGMFYSKSEFNFLFLNLVLLGDVVEIQLPSAATNPALAAESKHRGFAFVTFTQAMDAQDAIDNMDMNEFRGRVLKVNIAKPQKVPLQGLGNRPIWESEEWLQSYGQHPKDRMATGVRAKSSKEADENDDNDNKEE